MSEPDVDSSPEQALGIECFEPDGAASSASELSASQLTRAVIAEALQLGFARAGVTTAEPLPAARQRFQEFLGNGYAGGMSYLSAPERHDPRALLPSAQSVVVTAFAHGDPELVQLRRGRDGLSGFVARYARGEDYHLALKAKLLRLGRRVATLVGRNVLGRACVDTAPLLERELAVRAGLGFQGKSTLVIAPGVGSYVLLSELLLDVALEPSALSEAGCGSCRACLDACPTAAFAEPYRLDARRCISYLSIEYEGLIPRELRAAMGARVFGCDVCQETCPYNASPSRVRGSALGSRPALEAPDLIELLELGAAAYRRLVKRTALRRTSRTTLQRNAAIALGNSGNPGAVGALCRALTQNPRPVVRAHAAWALGRLAAHVKEGERRALSGAAHADTDEAVREEARWALAELDAAQGA